MACLVSGEYATHTVPTKANIQHIFPKSKFL